MLKHVPGISLGSKGAIVNVAANRRATAAAAAVVAQQAQSPQTMWQANGSCPTGRVRTKRGSFLWKIMAFGHY